MLVVYLCHVFPWLFAYISSVCRCDIYVRSNAKIPRISALALEQYVCVMISRTVYKDIYYTVLQCLEKQRPLEQYKTSTVFLYQTVLLLIFLPMPALKSNSLSLSILTIGSLFTDFPYNDFLVNRQVKITLRKLHYGLKLKQLCNRKQRARTLAAAAAAAAAAAGTKRRDVYIRRVSLLLEITKKYLDKCCSCLSFIHTSQFFLGKFIPANFLLNPNFANLEANFPDVSSQNGTKQRFLPTLGSICY